MSSACIIMLLTNAAFGAVTLPPYTIIVLSDLPSQSFMASTVGRTPGALAEALLALVHDAGAQRRQVEKFRGIHAVLRQNTAQKAADAVLAVLDAGRS